MSSFAPRSQVNVDPGSRQETPGQTPRPLVSRNVTMALNGNSGADLIPILNSEPARVIPEQATMTEILPGDPIARQTLAAETSRGRAHEAFLRVSDQLAQTMANHLSFQMALTEALWTAPPSVSIEEPEAEVVPVESNRPVLDRAACLEFAVGSVARVLGSAFEDADKFPTRVRLPDEPLMLVDRIMTIEGEPRSMTGGRVVTEHDILEGDWYLDHGKIPACIAVESGQADLFLSGYLGIDFETKGQAVYRLLDAVVTFHRAMPGPGEVISYDIRITEFFRQGDLHLFRFHFDATVEGEPLLTMRDGCAGFFPASALAAGKGIILRPLDLRPLPGLRPDDWQPLVPLSVESYDDAQVDALRRGDLGAAFGKPFDSLPLSDPLRLPGDRMTLVHRVPHLDPTGGRYGLGLIRTELEIHPDDWFLTCHFIDDRVMPGTLMYECCLHGLRIFLMRLGWVCEQSEVAFEPVPGVGSRLRCRGQVIETTRTAVFELAIKEIGYRPEPYAIADALMYADGKPVVEVLDMSLRLTGLTREGLRRLWDQSRERSVPGAEIPVLFTREQVLAFAEGKPSEAFGNRYLPFDEERVIARLPAPPFSFLDRVSEIDAEPWVMKAPASTVAAYDVPPEAWYFEANRQEQIPFAVLLEIPLQVCGWLAAYLGSALTSDEDLAFRNLGGSARLLAPVTSKTGTLTSRVRMTKVSQSGGMIIQHFDFETLAGTTPVYRGSTYFGFFHRESLLNQVGIREASLYRPAPGELKRSRSFDYPRDAPFPETKLRMIERVERFIPDGGPHGLGFIEGTMRVDPEAWFFKAHFHQDPVVPGSLGLESFLQLLKVLVVERWGRDGRPVAFETIGMGDEHHWIYRGQVTPLDGTVTTQAIVTSVDEDRRSLTADGFLSVDGRVVYQMNQFTLTLLLMD
ncbi:MAG: hypothetical protein NVSMB9_33220 [Isosphaeraceae bacterium]